MLMKETEEHTKDRKIQPSSQIGRIIIVKMTQGKLQIQCNPIKLSMPFFHRTRAKSPSIYMEPQKTSKSQNNLEREE